MARTHEQRACIVIAGNSFGAERTQKYGPLWKTNILGGEPAAQSDQNAPPPHASRSTHPSGGRTEGQ
jgi:hypothetical protein